MIRAGESGRFVEKFAKGFVAIGWHEIGDLSKALTPEEIREKYLVARLESKKGKNAANNDIAMIYKFRNVMKIGDWATTYNPETREYLLGKVTSDYVFNPETVDPDYPHVRRVKWEHHISRDALKPSSKNSFGLATLVSIREDVLADMLAIAGKPVDVQSQTDVEPEEEEKNFIIEEARERIKDKIKKLSDEELPQLVAAVLRAMSFKTRISPKGPDGGWDIFASPDTLGFQEPRIKVEVKHRPNTPIGAPAVRGFITTLRGRDKGLYVSSGGFTKDAKHETHNATVPVEWVDLNGLASLVVEHYDNFDSEGQKLFPLVKIYRPAE